MKKGLKLFSLVLIFVFVFSTILSGCGAKEQSKQSGQTTSNNDKPIDKAKEDSKKAPVTIKLKNKNDPTGNFQKLVDKFNSSHSDVQVQWQLRADTTDQEHNILMTQLSAGSAETDILLLDTCWLLEFAAAGWLEPLDGYLPKGYNDEFFDIALKLSSYNDKQYGVTRQIDLSGLYYRTDLLKEAGLEPPKTLDELATAAKKLTKDGIWGYSWQGKQYEGLVCDWVEILHNMGGAIFDNYYTNPGDRNITINSPEAAKATKFLYDLVKVDKVSPEGVLSYSEEPSRELFANGQAAMLRYWQSAPEILANEKLSKVYDKWDMVPLPAGSNGSHTCIGGWAWGINKFTKDKEAAWEVLKWFTEEDQQVFLMLNVGNQPSRPKVYDRPEVTSHKLWSKLAPRFKEIAKTGIPRPLSVVWTKQSDVIQRALHDVFADKKSPEEAMAWAAQEIEKIEKDFKANK